MKIIRYPGVKTWQLILKRPAAIDKSLLDSVDKILTDIKLNGDMAVSKYTRLFDKVSLTSFSVSKKDLENASKLVDNKLKDAIKVAKENIEKFHKQQILVNNPVETSVGVLCWQKSVPIDIVGIYIPGGSAPLFSSVLMLAIPAKLAGCKRIILSTPPDASGNVNPAILYAAHICGIVDVFKIGGIQAIGAMAFGTKSVPKVFKIFGPGNNYVTVAKQLVSLNEVAIDMPAGPSEVLVIADQTSNPAFVASDLLSQAEHGEDSQVILLTAFEPIIKQVLIEIRKQTNLLPRKNIALKALANSKAILVRDKEQIINLSNEYAPEHLIISTDNYTEYVDKISNAGSVFLGHYTPESAGDYASGTNHTLPTYGFAKSFSGVNIDSFMKKITFQHISQNGLNVIGDTIQTMAEAEQLHAHKNAVSIRLNQINTKP